jgi:hypothetical protein
MGEAIPLFLYTPSDVDIHSFNIVILHKMHRISTTKTSRLIQFREIVTLYSKDHMKHKAGINSGKNALPFNVKAGYIRMYSYGSAFKC